MNKTNLILLVLLLIQGAFIGVQKMTGGSNDTPVERGMLLDGLAVDAITKLVIQEGSEALEDKLVTLEKAGEDWGVAERWDHPADADKVDELLRELTALESADVVSTTGMHAVDLGVADDDFRKSVTLTADGVEHVVLLGTSGRGSSTHARIGGETEVVAVRNFSTWRVNARPDGWVDRQVVDVAPDQVASLEIAGPEGALRFTRTEGEVEGAAEWLMGDGDRQAGLSGDDLTELLSKATKVSASKVLGELKPVQSELLRVTLTQTDGARVSYVLGATSSDANFLLAVDGGTHLLEVGKWAVEPLLNASFDSLVPDEEARSLEEEAPATP